MSYFRRFITVNLVFVLFGPRYRDCGTVWCALLEIFPSAVEILTEFFNSLQDILCLSTNFCDINSVLAPVSSRALARTKRPSISIRTSSSISFTEGFILLGTSPFSQTDKICASSILFRLVVPPRLRRNLFSRSRTGGFVVPRDLRLNLGAGALRFLYGRRLC